MRSLHRIAQCTLLFSLVFAFQSLTIIGGVEGVWSYEALEAPYEYSKGEITIKKVDGDYQVLLNVNYSTFTVDEVTVNDNQVSFSLYIEDSKVDVNLEIDGDAMTGKAETDDGTISLKGSRK